jgi:hypothetical protein
MRVLKLLRTAGVLVIIASLISLTVGIIILLTPLVILWVGLMIIRIQLRGDNRG